MNDNVNVERIGLLLVHGIGDQKQYEHVQAVAKNFVDTAAILNGNKSVSVQLFPQNENNPPVSVIIKLQNSQDTRMYIIDFYETWWRDVGDEPKISRILKFWAWAISFVGTPGWFVDDTDSTSSPLNSSTKRKKVGFINRMTLFLKTTYFFVLLFPIWLITTVSAFIPGIQKIRFFSAVFSYLSSVKLYQEWSGKYRGTIEDYDQSRRMSIQRRLVRYIIKMAVADYNRWYLIGHSLGSVIAFKGLMSDGKSLARLLNMEEWENPVLFELKNKEYKIDFDYPDKPKCPVWLSEDDALNIDKIFSRCRGFITWGSPLETFAHAWPAMVQINKNRKAPETFEWINIYDPVDIVASKLTSFDNMTHSSEQCVIKPVNFSCRSSILITGAHTKYFQCNKYKDLKKVTPTVLTWIMNSDLRFDDAAKQNDLNRLSNREIIMRQVCALLQGFLVLVIGLIVWPFAIFALLRISLYLPGVVLDLVADENLLMWYQNIFNRIFEAISSYRVGFDLTKDLVIVAGTAVFLMLAGIIHYLFSKRPKTKVQFGAEETVIIDRYQA